VGKKSMADNFNQGFYNVRNPETFFLPGFPEKEL
jgi:hypothetical protein